MSNSAAFWVQMVALAVLVLDVTDGSSAQLGFVMATRTMPALVLGPFAGVAADMWNRKTILVVTRTVVTINAVWFATFVVTGNIELWQIYLFSAGRGVTQVFDQPARRAMIPSLVPGHAVTNAMTLNSGSVQLTRVFAAGLAGGVMAFGGTGSAFVLIALLYMAGIPLLMMMRAPGHERTGYQGLVTVLRDVKDGLDFAWHAPAVRGALIIAAVYFTFGASFIQVFIPLFAKGPLGIGDTGLASLMSVLGVGGILSTVVIAYINPGRHRGVVLLAALAVVGSFMALFSISSYLSNVFFAFLLVGMVGFAQSAFIPLFTALLAEAAPEDLRGRVMALLAYDQALVTAGAAAAGLSSAVLGPQVALFWFAGISVTAASLLAVAAPAVRRIS